MSPIDPKFGAGFKIVVKNLAGLIPEKDLMEAMAIAANNHYNSFMRQGTAYFGVLNSSTHQGWKDRPEFHFCFTQRWGYFYFMDAKDKAFDQTEMDSLARAVDAVPKRGGDSHA